MRNMVRTDVTFFYMTDQAGTDKTKAEPAVNAPSSSSSSGTTPSWRYTVRGNTTVAA